MSFYQKILLASVSLLLTCFLTAVAQDSANPAVKLLPNKLGDFRAAGAVETRKKELIDSEFRGGLVSGWARRSYLSENGQRFSVVLTTTPADASAFSLFTDARRKADKSATQGGTADARVGTAGFSVWDGFYNQVTFFKGSVFGVVREEGKSRGLDSLNDFARTLTDTLDRGEGEIPVLVRHLPDWENAKREALFVTNVESLQDAFANQSILSVLDFGGGAQAITASYSPGELVIIEFNTPQLATNNDQRIVSKLKELRTSGMPAPLAYRRVGNYSVFVFNGPSEHAANQLIDQVKYQQVVQWLGTDPNLYERYEKAQREFINTTLGVFVAVVKGSGLAFLICFAVGGLLGALLFMRRRKQQRMAEAYSDAGGMLRLNLDDITPQTDPSRLVGPGH